MAARRAEHAPVPPHSNAAIAFYRKLRGVAPRRSDLVASDIAKYANRAVALTDDDRRAILLDLARLLAGELACPTCGSEGPHVSNGHHRVGGIRLTCAVCTVQFRAVHG